MLLEDRRGVEDDNRGPYIIPITKFVKDVLCTKYVRRRCRLFVNAVTFS